VAATGAASGRTGGAQLLAVELLPLGADCWSANADACCAADAASILPSCSPHWRCFYSGPARPAAQLYPGAGRAGGGVSCLPHQRLRRPACLPALPPTRPHLPCLQCLVFLPSTEGPEHCFPRIAAGCFSTAVLHSALQAQRVSGVQALAAPVPFGASPVAALPAGPPQRRAGLLRRLHAHHQHWVEALACLLGVPAGPRGRHGAKV
jgi:hypothetical protein